MRLEYTIPIVFQDATTPSRSEEISVAGEFATHLEPKIAMTHTKHHRDKIYVEKETEELHEIQDKNNELQQVVGQHEGKALLVLLDRRCGRLQNFHQRQIELLQEVKVVVQNEHQDAEIEPPPHFLQCSPRPLLCFEESIYDLFQLCNCM